MVACCGCNGLFPEADGPTHPYMPSSPGCWAAYGQVLAREYADYPAFGGAHRLTVDAFAAQHPGGPAPENVRSVGFHLCRLCLLLERGLDPARANAAIVAIAAHKSRFTRLPAPSGLGTVTVADVLASAGPEAHRAAVRRWAASVREAWGPCHGVVRGWIDGIFPDAEPGAAPGPAACIGSDSS